MNGHLCNEPLVRCPPFRVSEPPEHAKAWTPNRAPQFLIPTRVQSLDLRRTRDLGRPRSTFNFERSTLSVERWTFLSPSMGMACTIAALLITTCAVLAADESAFGINHRIPWTTSRVVGSPEPPLP